MAKTKFMIAVGASVVVVREGKRKTIAPGGGIEFTEDEIRDINAAVPGALRAPVNEGRSSAPVDADDDTGVDADGDTVTKPAKPAKAAKGKGKAAKAAKPAAAETPADEDADDGDDEDEDI